MATKYPGLPPPPTGGLAALLSWLRKAATIIDNLLLGHLNAVGTFTLAANVATTTVSDLRVTPDSCIAFMPTTANAAAEIGNGTMYVGTKTAGASFVVTHANNAQADRTFAYAIIG